MTDDYSKKIDQYFNKELNEAERAAFEKQLTEDQALAQAFAQRKQMEDFLAVRPGREQLKAQAADLGAEFFASSPKQSARRVSIRRNLYWISGAAAAAILLLLFLPRWLNSPPTYAQFAEHRPLSLQERGNDGQNLGPIETAFNQGDYATAQELLGQYLQQQPTDLQAQLYASITALELGQAEKAISQLRPISEGTSAYRSSAQWYLALAYLQQANYAQCRNSLQQIPAQNYWYNKAQRLLKKLPRE